MLKIIFANVFLSVYLSVILFFSSFVFAANTQKAGRVKLDMTLTLNGHVSTPKVITLFDEAASIEQRENNGNGYRISVLSQAITTEGHKAVRLDMEVYKIEKNVETLVNAPRIVTLYGEKAEIRQKDSDELILAVTPTLVR